MKLIFNLGIALCVVSFIFGCSSFGYQSPRYVKLAHKITEKTAKQLKEQKNLFLAGTGGGMMNDIQMMAMGFDYYQEVDLASARELVLYTLDKYLMNINNNVEVRPYLHDYPFTAKNIQIRIWIYNPDRSELPLDKIYCITAIDGMLEYYTRSDPYHPICEETYEEALQKANLNQGFTEKTAQIKDEKANVVVAKDGAKVRIKLESLEYSVFELSGEGFKPYESLNFISNSSNEIIHFTMKADKNGDMPPMGFQPAVVGKSGGICYIDILRKEGPIQIKLPWGTEIKSSKVQNPTGSALEK